MDASVTKPRLVSFVPTPSTSQPHPALSGNHSSGQLRKTHQTFFVVVLLFGKQFLRFFFSRRSLLNFDENAKTLTPIGCAPPCRIATTTQMATEMIRWRQQHNGASHRFHINLLSIRIDSEPEPNPRLVIPGCFQQITHRDPVLLLFYSADYGIAVALALFVFYFLHFTSQSRSTLEDDFQTQRSLPLAQLAGERVGEQTPRERNSQNNDCGHFCCFDCFAKQTNDTSGFRCVADGRLVAGQSDLSDCFRMISLFAPLCAVMTAYRFWCFHFSVFLQQISCPARGGGYHHATDAAARDMIEVKAMMPFAFPSMVLSSFRSAPSCEHQ